MPRAVTPKQAKASRAAKPSKSAKKAVIVLPDIIPLTNEVMFKGSFGVKKCVESLTAFLIALCPWLPAEDFAKVTFPDTHRKRRHKDDKLSVLDICVTLTSGRMIAIEIQMVPFFALCNRAQFYNSKMMVETLEKGMTYAQLPEVITIFILVGKPFFTGSADYRHEYRMLNVKSPHVELPNSQVLLFVELANLPEVSDGSALWFWLRLFGVNTREELLWSLASRGSEKKSFLKKNTPNVDISGTVAEDRATRGRDPSAVHRPMGRVRLRPHSVESGRSVATLSGGFIPPSGNAIYRIPDLLFLYPWPQSDKSRRVAARSSRSDPCRPKSHPRHIPSMFSLSSPRPKKSSNCYTRSKRQDKAFANRIVGHILEGVFAASSSSCFSPFDPNLKAVCEDNFVVAKTGRFRHSKATNRHGRGRLDPLESRCRQFPFPRPAPAFFGLAFAAIGFFGVVHFPSRPHCPQPHRHPPRHRRNRLFRVALVFARNSSIHRPRRRIKANPPPCRLNELRPEAALPPFQQRLRLVCFPSLVFAGRETKETGHMASVAEAFGTKQFQRERGRRYRADAGMGFEDGFRVCVIFTHNAIDTGVGRFQLAVEHVQLAQQGIEGETLIFGTWNSRDALDFFSAPRRRDLPRSEEEKFRLDLLLDATDFVDDGVTVA